MHEEKMNHFKGLVESKLKHSYLDNYLNPSMIEDEKIIALDAILNNETMSQKEKYIVTVMLIQFALNIHDLVTEGPERPEHTHERISKQLTVLAGDYYSGLYYLVLSETNDFKLTHTLATAIKNINELKVKIHYKEYASPDELIDMVGAIDSMLFNHVAEFVGEHLLSSFVNDWLLLILLMNESMDANQNKSVLIHSLQGTTLYPQEISYAINERIASLALSLETSINQLSNDYLFLKKKVFNTLEKVHLNDNRTISIMEEG